MWVGAAPVADTGRPGGPLGWVGACPVPLLPAGRRAEPPDLVGTVYRTRDGDTLDWVVWRHYGLTIEATEAVLAANPALADHGPTLPDGLRLLLPAWAGDAGAAEADPWGGAPEVRAAPAARYQTRAGDTLDWVVWRHYGATAGTAEAVLAANPALADVGPVLPGGLWLVLPVLAASAEDVTPARLWN